MWRSWCVITRRSRGEPDGFFPVAATFHPMTEYALEQDTDFVRRSSRLVAIWITILAVGGVGLIVYGDALMALAT